MKTKALAALLAALTVAAIAGGCGDEEGSGGAAAGDAANGSGATSDSAGSATSDGASDAAPGPIATSELSKARYVKRANAICTRSREERFEKVSAFAEDYEGDSEEEAIEDAYDAVFIPTTEALLAELRELGAPAGDEQLIERYLAGRERALELTKTRDRDEASRAINRQLNRAGAIARRYGLRECTYG